MKQSVATEMTSMMIGVYNEGTGQTAKPYGYTIAGKTGTVETPKTWGNGLGAKDSWVSGTRRTSWSPPGPALRTPTPRITCSLDRGR